MSRPKSIVLAALVSLPLATAALAQTIQAPTLNPNWRLDLAPSPHGTIDPRTEEFRQWLDAMRSYTEQYGRPFPPIGAVPHGSTQAHDITDLLLRFRPAQPLPTLVDGNHDGIVSDEEAAGHADAIFTALDLDGDRALSPDEIERRHMVVLFAQPDDSAPEESARFTALDGNADGTVSKAEFLDVARAHYEAARDPVTDTVTPWSYRRTDWF